MFAVKHFIQLTYVPTMLFGGILAGIYLVSNDYGYHSLFGLLLAAIAISFAAERIVPYDKSWNRDHCDSRRDIIHALVNEAANTLSVASLPLIVSLLPEFGFWPKDWLLWEQLLLAICIADCGITLVHFFSHKYEFLWKFHAVHHSVKRMYGFNGLMKHPLHQALETIGGTLPLILMGIPLDVAVLLAFSVAVQLLLQHSNVDVKIGPLRYLLALSPLHRFHHIKWPVEGDVNFGLFTTIWDRMLGTAVYEADRRFTSDDLGIGKEPDYPNAYVAQLARPFKKQEQHTAVQQSS